MKISVTKLNKALSNAGVVRSASKQGLGSVGTKAVGTRSVGTGAVGTKTICSSAIS